MTKKTASNLRSRHSSDLLIWKTLRYAFCGLRRHAIGVVCPVTLAAGFVFGSVPASVLAQQAGSVVSQIVTIDRQSLFSDTQYGRRVVETVETERVRLASETRKVEEALVKEERELTDKRDSMSPEEFRKIAKAFDEKVQALRTEGTEREQEFVRTLEREQAAFFDRIGPILGQLVRELGAVVILDRRAILLTTRNIDITKLAVERIDQVLGDGRDIQDGASTTPAGETSNPDQPAPEMPAFPLGDVTPDSTSTEN
ncbi:OmpH family outer membrane protein [Aliiroseovarius sp. F47248L]|uniref:OmpH family outer membrane protein n=1 Tax=Aliiroseovarius sp. F47248L TaxID=2926420 RepID=UPI001FF4609E|nr:OmpH family outer membrane protein [Aliiroseovarius sp. F47248L]MCK0138740.1 OmpH family outer membrane protein [Aliiroseovarius sp. F47248L]